MGTTGIPDQHNGQHTSGQKLTNFGTVRLMAIGKPRMLLCMMQNIVRNERKEKFMDYEIDPQTVTLENFQSALANFNSEHSIEISIGDYNNDSYTITGGDDAYFTGNLKECAIFWAGYLAGQTDGDTFLNVDGSEET